MATTPLAELKLSVFRAMLGNIPPSIFCVSMRLEGNALQLHFYAMADVDEESQEDLSCIETEVMADFSHLYDITSALHICPNPHEQKPFLLQECVQEGEIILFLQKLPASHEKNV